MYKHFEYCEAIARRLKPISHRDDECHFLRSDEVEEITDLVERASSIRGMVLVAIDGHNSDFGWNNSENLMEMPQFFIVVMKNILAGDIDSYHAAKLDCKCVAQEIIKRMMLDRHYELNGLEYLDPQSFSRRGVGPIGDNFFGVIVGFNLNMPGNYLLNDEMWK